MKNKIIFGFLILFLAFTFIGCSMFKVPFSPEDIANYKGRPDWWYELPTDIKFVLPNALSTHIKDLMVNGQFSSNELDGLVNTAGAIYPFPGRNTMNTTNFPSSPSDHWSVTVDAYSTNLAFVFYYWADSTWTWGNHQLDGGDENGVYIGDAAQRRQHTTQNYMAALALEKANLIEDAILAYYYVVVEGYRYYNNYGQPVTVYNADGYSSWCVTMAAMDKIKYLTGRYGKSLGIMFTGGILEGVGDVTDAALWPDYKFTLGYFVPYSK